METMPDNACGVLEVLKGRGGFLRDSDRSFQPGTRDVFVSQQLDRPFRVVTGARVSGPTQPARQGLQLPVSTWSAI